MTVYMAGMICFIWRHLRRSEEGEEKVMLVSRGGAAEVASDTLMEDEDEVML